MANDTHPADAEKTKIGKSQYKQARMTAARRNTRAVKKLADTVKYPDRRK